VLVLDGRREDQAPVVGFYSWLRSTEAVCASCSDSKLNHTPSKQGRVFFLYYCASRSVKKRFKYCNFIRLQKFLWRLKFR
jgi:hypothetical protein